MTNLFQKNRRMHEWPRVPSHNSHIDMETCSLRNVQTSGNRNTYRNGTLSDLHRGTDETRLWHKRLFCPGGTRRRKKKEKRGGVGSVSKRGPVEGKKVSVVTGLKAKKCDGH